MDNTAPGEQSISEHLPSISIVIATRNEQKNLERLIPLLLDQNYGGLFEILIVDDHSDDRQLKWLKESTKGDPRIRILELAGTGRHGKKAAVRYGVERAVNEIILQTDADCTPGREWVLSIARAFQSGTRVVFGPVHFKTGNTMKDALLELEMRSLSALCGTGIQLKEPFLSNAANMAYYHEDFISWQPFNRTESASGDDVDLMFAAMQANPRSIHYLKNPDATIRTEAPGTFRDFVQQRLRWASKTDLRGIPFSGVIFFGFNFSLFVAYLLGASGFMEGTVVLVLVLGKWAADCMFFRTIHIFFQREKAGIATYLYILVLVILYPIYVSLIAILSKFVPYTWKGRTRRI